VKSYKEFKEQTLPEEVQEINEEIQKTTIVIRKKGLGWEARFPAVNTTLGIGEDPIEAVKNLLNHPEGTGEDWEREGRLQRFRLSQEA